AQGRLTLHALPDLRKLAELSIKAAVQCAALAPSGSQLALGCDDGRIRLVTIEGFDSVPLAVTATQTSRRTATRFQRLFGRSQLVRAVAGSCPVCGRAFELPQSGPLQPWPCSGF